MRQFYKIVLLGLCLAIIAALPALAQEETGSGAPVIQPNFGADIATLNPIIADDGTSVGVINLIYPFFLAVDPETGYYAPSARGGIVSNWEISEDGRTYTFTIRDDWNWSDGTPITSEDVKYVWDAIQDPNVAANGNLLPLRDFIASVEAPDAQTLVITFNDALCNSLDNAASIPVVPSHVYKELYGTDYSLMNDSDFNLNPTVSAGPFVFQNYRPGEQVTLLAYEGYPDTYSGAVIPEGYILKNVTDQTVQVEQFLAGQLTNMSAPSNRQDELQELVDAGEYQGYLGGRWNMRFVGLNLADPENPQPGLDEDGEAIPQGNHPIFGDVRVRQALQYAINFEDLNVGAFGGFGIQSATHSVPFSWSNNDDIQPYPFDTAQAASLLEEAGWTDSDGDGIRECNGCEFAEPGATLSFELLTNAGNTSQEALGTLLQAQWGDVGFDVTFSPIDFNVLVETFQAQTFDAVMIFWGFGFPVDPDGVDVTFGPVNDVPGVGFNAVSYNNPRVNELLDQARTLPGCDQAERKVLYDEVLQILHDESPWIWLGGAQVLSVAQPGVEGWAPNPQAGLQTNYNIDSWIVPGQ
jgi:peptide/nickel transport system substrate-binding protein